MNTNVRFEVLVWIEGTQYYLDTFDVVSVPLNYQISDIRDIDKRKSSYSLTLDLPETSNNRFVFNSISDLSVDLTYFNPNKNAPVELLVDSFVVFRGNLQLTSVSVDLDTNVTKLNCVVYSENDDFFSIIGDDYLSDLDFSELGHTYSQSNIIDSWSKDWSNGYYYPWIDTKGMSLASINGSLGVTASMKVTDFFPATYIKYIWNKIFSTAGYTYRSDFLNGSVFENLLMPFSGKILQKPQDFKNSLVYQVGLSFTQSIGAPYTGPSFSLPINPGGSIGFYTPVKFDQETTPYSDPNNLWDTSTYQFTNNYSPKIEKVSGRVRVLINNGYTYGTELLQLFLLRSKYPSTITSSGVTYYAGNDVPFYGTNYPKIGGGQGSLLENQEILLAKQPVIPFPGGQSWYSVKSPTIKRSDGTIVIFTPTIFQLDPGATIESTNNDPNVTFNIVNTPNGRRLEVIVDFESDVLDDRSPVPSTTPIMQSNFYTPLYNGEHYRLFVSRLVAGLDLTPPYILFHSIEPSSYIGNLVDSILTTNQPLDYNTVIPQNSLKQKEFLTSIIKMFNLYIEPSKDNSNELIIEPRNEYYASGSFKDWSSKLDISYPIEEIILSETQEKATLFTYKKDSDYHNQDYESRLKRLYGDVRYVVDNDFTKAEKKIENIFSPTPLALLEGSQKIILPSIYKLNNGRIQQADSYNYRILLKSQSGTISLQPEDYWKFEGSTMTSYPYVGHFDNPYDPTVDINWGQSYLYYSNNPTNNNLFEVYWRKTMNEISDLNSRLITCYLKLSPEDIAKFRFNDNIFLQIDKVGAYYKVNKITYDASDYKTSKVELLKSLDVNVPSYKYTNQPTSVNVTLTGVVSTGPVKPGVIDVSGRTNVIIKTPALVNGFNNTLNGGITSVLGNNNAINSKITGILGDFNNVTNGSIKQVFGSFNQDQAITKSFIFGDSNTVSQFSKSGFVVGDNNIVDSQKSLVLGYNNKVIGENIIVLGSDIKATSSNKVYLPGSPIAAQNYTNAGFDVVLNPFSEVVINYISGSRDKVRQLGTDSPIMLIKSGRDEVF